MYFNSHIFDLRPLAPSECVVSGENYRFTVLTSRLIRMEYSPSGYFEDRATKLAFCRDLDRPNYKVIEQQDSVEIITEHLHLYYDKKPFSTEGLSVKLLGF